MVEIGCLHEHAKVRKDVLQNTLSLLCLQGEHGKAQFRKEMEVGAVYETWTERARGRLRLLGCSRRNRGIFQIKRLDARVASLRRI